MKARHKDTGEIIELAEEGIISRDGRRFCWYQVDLIPEPIDECKLSLPSNLDEVAQKVEDYYDVGEEHGYLCCHRGDIKDAFKAGAEWMQNRKFLEVLENEPLDSAARKVFEDWIPTEVLTIDGVNGGIPLYNQGALIMMFKAGAEWMARQGVTKEAVIGMATEEISINVSQQTLDELDLFPGDKVVVQIRKK